MHLKNTAPHLAQLHLPHASLSGLIFMAVERNTLGHCFNDKQRFNYYPASPFPTISWIFEGQLHMVQNGDATRPQLDPSLPNIIFAGPHDQPSASWSPSSVHALTVSFYPEKLSQLFDISMTSYMNQVCPLEAVAPDSWLMIARNLINSMHNRACNDAFAQLQENLLNELVHSNQLKAIQQPTIHHWLRNVLTQTALSPSGQSMRQTQRRIKQWTGQNRKELQLYERTERIFEQFSKTPDPINWPALSFESGCADQSHMGRQVRRVTGHSPQKLQQLILSEEGFWLYRLLEQYHRKDSQNS